MTYAIRDSLLTCVIAVVALMCVLPAEAFGQNDPIEFESLIAALGDEDSDIRGAAVEALEANEMRNIAVERMLVALKDSVDRVRVGAVRALSELGDPRAVEPLIEAWEWRGYSQAA